MGVRILSVDGGGETCLFDSVTGFAFGPVSDEDTLQEFLKWVGENDLPDLRTLAPAVLENYWGTFRSAETTSEAL